MDDVEGIRTKLMLLACSAALLSGCHCMPFKACTEKHCDHIDDFSDRRPWADRCYHAKLDLTRLGRSDGPECCRNQCCH